MKGDGSGSSSSISPLVSFTLGAAMATVCVLFFMSASPGRRLVDVAAWSHNNGTAFQLQHHHLQSVADAAPAPAPVKVRIGVGFFFSSKLITTTGVRLLSRPSVVGASVRTIKSNGNPSISEDFNCTRIMSTYYWTFSFPLCIIFLPLV